MIFRCWYYVNVDNLRGLFTRLFAYQQGEVCRRGAGYLSRVLPRRRNSAFLWSWKDRSPKKGKDGWPINSGGPEGSSPRPSLPSWGHVSFVEDPLGRNASLKDDLLAFTLDLSILLADAAAATCTWRGLRCRGLCRLVPLSFSCRRGSSRVFLLRVTCCLQPGRRQGTERGMWTCIVNTEVRVGGGGGREGQRRSAIAGATCADEGEKRTMPAPTVACCVLSGFFLLPFK